MSGWKPDVLPRDDAPDERRAALREFVESGERCVSRAFPSSYDATRAAHAMRYLVGREFPGMVHVAQRGRKVYMERTGS